MTKDPATRRYTWGLLLVMTGYVLILLGVNAYFEHGAPTGPLAYVAAALPALPIIAVFALFGRLLVELKDEYVRMLMVRQSLIATAFGMSSVLMIAGGAYLIAVPALFALLLPLTGKWSTAPTSVPA